MRREHTILAPQMSPVHFRLLEPALRRSGYRVEVLEKVSARDVDTGLTFVNNDACYPAVMVVGQLVEALASGRYDPDGTSVLITQTGGMCRATNYAGLLRKGLRDAGYAQVPVLALSTSGIEKNPGFSWTPSLVHHLIQAVVLGDLLHGCLLRVRPYAAAPRRCGRRDPGQVTPGCEQPPGRRHRGAGMRGRRARPDRLLAQRHVLDRVELRQSRHRQVQSVDQEDVAPSAGGGPAVGSRCPVTWRRWRGGP